MNAAKTVFTFLGIFSFFILSMGLASADTILLEDFETATDLADDWTLTNNGVADWAIATTDPATGLQYAEANPQDGTGSPDSAMERTIATTGYKEIVLSYDRKLGGGASGFEAGEDEFNVSYSNDGGTTWTVLETNDTANDASYVSKSHIINDALSNDNSVFKIRFECTANAADEFCRVDNVALAGTLMVYSLDITAPTSSVEYGQNATITLTNDGDFDLSNIVLSETSSFGATFSDITSLIAGATSSSITVALDSLTGIKFGANILTIFAQDSVQTDANDTATITIDKHFCDSGEVGTDLRIKGVDFDNDGSGDDDEWELLDEITVEVEVENMNSTEDLDDIIVELGLYDSNGNDVADDLEFLSGGENSEESDKFDIEEDEEETIKFVFRVPADLEDGTYKLAVKTYSDDFGEDTQCTDSVTNNDLNQGFYQEITVDRESDREKSIVVDDVEMDSQVTCGQTVSGTFTVFNIGDDDEEKVKITMTNSELGLSETFEILNDLDSGDEETISFSFEIPEGVEDKTYTISFRTYFDYDDGAYGEVSEDTFYGTVAVLGCDTQTEESVLVTAELDSEAEAGEDLIVTSTITNLGEETATFAIDVTGLGDWAELVSLSDEVVTLTSGESKEITITLNVNSDAEGTQTFVIETNSNGNLEVQQVEVNIAEGTGFGGLSLGNNKMLLLFIIVNLILVLLIVAVAVRLARR